MISRTQSPAAGQKVTWIGAGVNAGLIVFKFLAGVLGHSQALIADAVHSLSDFITDIIVLYGLWAGRREPDQEHQFGHARIETLAALSVGLALLAVAGYLGYQASLGIYRHAENHPTALALAGALISIVVKEWLYRYTVRVGRRIKSPAVVANAWHHRSDAMSSVAVFLGLLGAQIRPGWHILDAWAALLVSFFILKVGLDVLWGAVREMVDTAPNPRTMEKIKDCILSVPGVLGEHDLKVRSSGGLLQMQIHIDVDEGLSVGEGHRLAKEVESCLFARIKDVGEVIVHVDPVRPPLGRFGSD